MIGMRKKVGILVCAGLFSVGIVAGTGEAHAAPIPTLAVTPSGNSDWQLTFDRGTSRAETCDVRAGSVRIDDTEEFTHTLRGGELAAGRHAVTVRCGDRVSPLLWIYAPRGQINDIGTWLSNTTAGALGI